MSESFLVLLIIAGLLFVLIRDILPASIAFLGALIAVLVAEVISTEEALSGFSNQVMFIIGAFFVISQALHNSVNTSKVTHLILGNTKRIRRKLLRLSVPIALASGFIANTPVVASMIQPVEQWSRDKNLSSSKLLMPLSYAAILGGVLTLTGTSTNLLVSGLLVEAGQEPLGFFEVSKIGVPVAIVGIVTMVLVIPKLLPARKSAIKSSERATVIEYVALDSIDGKNVEQANLRNLNTMYLASIIRTSGGIKAPVGPETVIGTGDVLQFVGEITDVKNQPKLEGLKAKAAKHESKLGLKKTSYYEVVLGHGSPVIGKTLKEVQFRGYYQAAVFAVHRSGKRVRGKLGDIKLHAGDTLLLVSDDYFSERWSGKRDFLIVNRLEGEKNIDTTNLLKIAGIGLISLVIGLSGAELITVLLAAAFLCVAFGVVPPREAIRSIDFELLLLIATSISFATAVVNSGLSGSIADGLTSALGSFGDAGLLLSFIVASLILTELVTNTAAASLLFPIAITTAAANGLDPRIAAIVVAISCSLSFLSPFGYQTNTMVYGPGGYKFLDYIRIGSVLTLATATTVLISALMLI